MNTTIQNAARRDSATLNPIITLVVLLACLSDPWLATLPGAEATSHLAKRKPNIVLILADDLGYGDVGCYGASKVKTPNIDRLASEGRRFMDAHSASAVCTPSRYALLTGEYPFRKNLWGPVMNPSPLVVKPSQTTIASLLKREGYATACFGKWHLSFGSKPNQAPSVHHEMHAPVSSLLTIAVSGSSLFGLSYQDLLSPPNQSITRIQSNATARALAS